MNTIRQILKAINVATDYPFVLLVAGVMWVIGLGMTCAYAEMKSGVHVTIHGLGCKCLDRDDK